MADESRPLILVVEDDPGAGILQRRRLERADFRVEVAADVQAALSKLQRGGINLVVMDYRLGSTTGLDLHRRMKAAGFEVPVIIVSGAMDDAVVIEAMRTGVRDVVLKNTDYLDYLPAAVRSVLSQTAAVPEPAPQERRGACVLIVEDDPGTAALERRQLERAGYEVAVAETADEALRAVRQGHVNLAVLDLRLGDTSGIDLYEQLKAEGLNVPAILVTAFPDQAVAIRALRAGIRDFVPKAADFLDCLPAAVDRVAAQVRVELKMVESELRLASIIGTTMDAIVMCDDQLRIVLFNRSAEEMFGCTADEALKQRLDRFIPAPLLRDPADRASAGLQGGMRRRVEVDGIAAGGLRVPIEVTVSDVVVHDRHLFTVIARDISQRRRSEAELREADRRKDEFLGMLAHELRNPLAAITAAGEVLHRTIEDARAQRLTAVVRRQARALARMVDDLLDVSRVTLGKIQLEQEPLVLGEIVKRAADSARDAVAKASLHLAVQIDPEPLWLKGDATRLDQVLTNLLNNAVKFTPAGGRIRVQAVREADQAVIRVSDTGIGMDGALLPKVFDLFVQGDTSLDRSKSGLGIGLALVRQIVTLHGGTVAAFSRGPGKGSEFVVRLPVAPVEEAASADADAVAETQADRQMRVLVVDDQRDLADSVALLIESLGHRARAVYDGATALTVSRADVPDVMFVDIGMPGMTGYEVARQVRLDPELSQVRLVALTGYGRDQDRAQVMEAGFDVHLTKPVDDSKVQALMSDLHVRVVNGRD
jgi:PAS domain S-box-containing protein